MTFDEYWKGYWKPTGQPAILDMAMKEIGQKAWEAALTTQKEPVAKLQCSDGLVAAAELGAKWMRWWLGEYTCDCEGYHICGRPEREMELQQIEDAIKEAIGN